MRFTPEQLDEISAFWNQVETETVQEAIMKAIRAASERPVENTNEVRELTIDEWYVWKKNPNHDPICILWEHDYTPMWILDAKKVHEPALLMGKCKLFTGKLTSEQCMNIKWKE